jgi:hypothetical protein
MICLVCFGPFLDLIPKPFLQVQFFHAQERKGICLSKAVQGQWVASLPIRALDV